MPKKNFSKNLMRFLAVAGICLLLLFLNPKGIFTPVRNVLLAAAYPFQKTFYLTSRTLAGTAKFLGSIGNLKNENERLLKENNTLAARVASLAGEKKENEQLRDQLQLAPRQKFNLLGSFVIGQDPQRLGSWIMVDRGSADGIRTGMPVIAYEGILIGKIDEVSLASSKVSLLTDSASAANVSDLETGARGILKGAYGLGFVMDMVTQNEVLNVGDTVVTSGLGGDLPKGFLIGKIQEVRASGDRLFQQAIVIPRVRYSDLDTVFIVKN